MPAEQSHKLWLHALRKCAWFLNRLSDGWMSGLLAWSLVFGVLQPGICEDRITYLSANGEETRVRVGSLSQYVDGEIQFSLEKYTFHRPIIFCMKITLFRGDTAIFQ